MNRPLPSLFPRQSLRGARLFAGLMATTLTACVTMDGATGNNQRRSASSINTGAASAPARTPVSESPGAPGSPLEYTPTPSRQGESTSAGARTRAEKQLAEDTANFRNVVFGGIVKRLMTTGVDQAITCIDRFIPYMDSRNARSKSNAKDRLAECGTRVALNEGIRGYGDGYRVAKTQEAARNRLRAVESVTEDMEADNQKLREMVDASEEILKESSGRLGKLREDVAQRKTRADEARRLTEQDRANVANLEKAIAEAKQAREAYQKTAQQMPASSGGKSRDLDAEIKKMDQQIAALERNLKQLQSAMVPFAA